MCFFFQREIKENFFRAVRALLFRATCARGFLLFSFGERKKRSTKESSCRFLCVGDFVSLLSRKLRQVDISPRSFTDKAVSTRHSANIAALRQIYFVQTRSSCTHRAPIMLKFYLIRHAFEATVLVATPFCVVPAVNFAAQN